MPYKVYKIMDDNRNHMCGLSIPNGGWYHIMEMTFENHKQLVDLSTKPGYSVDFVAGEPGFYDPDDNLVDPATVEIDRATKIVINYQKVTKKRGDKQVPTKSKMVEGERDAVIQECLTRGLRIDKRWSTKVLKDVLAKSKQPREQFGSLAIGNETA